jgi:hypothetical protein
MELDADSIGSRGLNGSRQQGPPCLHPHPRCRDAGEDEGWLRDVAVEMDQEDGLIWVYSTGDDGVMAFTDFGIETLVDLIETTRADPHLPNRPSTDPPLPTASRFWHGAGLLSEHSRGHHLPDPPCDLSPSLPSLTRVTLLEYALLC